MGLLRDYEPSDGPFSSSIVYSSTPEPRHLLDVRSDLPCPRRAIIDKIVCSLDLT